MDERRVTPLTQESVQATQVGEPTHSTKKLPKKDQLLVEAVEFARAATLELTRPETVGEHLGAHMVDERVALHRFACLEVGYPGWAWAVTLSRAPRSKQIAVCELDLLPDEGALLAPDWVPWKERLQPSDISRDDVIPYEGNDARLISGFEQTDEGEADSTQFPEFGLGRKRVLSPVGMDRAANRWYESDRGPKNGALTQVTPRRATCSSCGFMIKLNGALGSLFGVCANEWSPDDGTVVSYDHACGAHSETEVAQSGSSQWPIVDSRLDDYALAWYRPSRRVTRAERSQQATQAENPTGDVNSRPESQVQA